MTLCIEYPLSDEPGDIDSMGVGHMPIDTVASVIDSLEKDGIPWSWTVECDHLDFDDCGRPCHHLQCVHCGVLVATPDTIEEC